MASLVGHQQRHTHVGTRGKDVPDPACDPVPADALCLVILVQRLAGGGGDVERGRVVGVVFCVGARSVVHAGAGAGRGPRGPRGRGRPREEGRG